MGTSELKEDNKLVLNQILKKEMKEIKYESRTPTANKKTITYNLNSEQDLKKLKELFGNNLINELLKEFKDAKALRIIYDREKKEITLVLLGTDNKNKRNKILATGNINKNKETKIIIA